MKLGEALSLLKKNKSGLARLISLRKENVYIYEDEKPGFDLEKLTKEINDKLEEIRKLKINIQKTNINSKVSGENILLAEAIIKVNDIRSKINNLTNLSEQKRDSWTYREKDEKKKIFQLNQGKIEDEIEELENAKSELDNKIQITNWTVELIS